MVLFERFNEKGILRVVRLRGFEPPTPASGGQCSIQLSYKRMFEICLVL